jgi:GNAT superfamily N-acetyltransferase
MSDLHTTETAFLDDELQMRPLLGDPPHGFDCGSAEQNAFLYERAWNDARCGITVTHLLYVKGMLAAYVTVMADRIKLGSRERPRGVVYGFAPAVKIAQLGVDRRFAGCGLGKLLVAYAVQMAVMFRRRIGCRYVTLDARTEELVRWYEAQGFVRNKEEQKLRIVDAERRGRTPDGVPVSLRFDLRERTEME